MNFFSISIYLIFFLFILLEKQDYSIEPQFESLQQFQFQYQVLSSKYKSEWMFYSPSTKSTSASSFYKQLSV